MRKFHPLILYSMGEERLLGHHTEGELQCLQEHMLNCSQPHVGKTRKGLVRLLVLLDVLVDEDRPTTARFEVQWTPIFCYL